MMILKLTKFCIQFLLLINFCKFNLAQIGSSCTTPNGELGKCVSIYSCSLLYNSVTSSNPEQLRFLRQSQCGYEIHPLVCCGSYDNFHKKSHGTLTNTKAPKISKKNLLPSESNCGIQDYDRILGGEKTHLLEFPWMALLQYKKGSTYSFSCGGTLISSRYVLTAAHCVTGQILSKIGKLVTVRLGEWDMNTGQDCVTTSGYEICNDEPLDVGVEEAIPHENYKDTDMNRYDDIALIRLNRDVQYTDYIKPICLPSESSQVGSLLYVSGWGRTEYSKYSPVKLKLQVPLVKFSQCFSRFRNAGVNLRNKQLCAGGERGKDSCNGDSGGPLMTVKDSNSAQWYIEGIVSFGARCGMEKWPGIYTKVSEYIDWIEENMHE